MRWAAREPYEFALFRVGRLDAALRVNDEQMVLHAIDPRFGIEIIGISTATSFMHRGSTLGDLGRFSEADAAFRPPRGSRAFVRRE